CGCHTDGDCQTLSAPDGGVTLACCGNQCVDPARQGLRSCGGGLCVSADKCCTDSDCTSPPGGSPAACYVGSCSGGGGSCTYAMPPENVVCATTCCRPSHGSCSADCTLACDTGYADCDGNPTNGCELSLYDVKHCGSCWNFCSFPNATAACPTGTCVLST